MLALQVLAPAKDMPVVCTRKRARPLVLTCSHLGSAEILAEKSPVTSYYDTVNTDRRRVLTAAAAFLGAQAATALGQIPAAVAQEKSEKRRNVPINELMSIVERDFQDGQYYITGRLSPELFEDDCVFTDPTTNVKGVDTYSKAVAALFDPKMSRADLLSAEVEDDHHFMFRWRFDAALNTPVVKLKFKPYTGTTRYTTNDAGLIYKHEEAWDISASEAFLSIFFPSYGSPPAPPLA